MQCEWGQEDKNAGITMALASLTWSSGRLTKSIKNTKKQPITHYIQKHKSNKQQCFNFHNEKQTAKVQNMP